MNSSKNSVAMTTERGVHEGQPARLAAQRAFADAGERHGIGIGLGIEAGHDSLPEQRAVVAYRRHQCAAVFCDRGEMAFVVASDSCRQREQTARIEPFRQVVLRSVVFEQFVRYSRDEFLHLGEVFGPSDFGARRQVTEHEVAERELRGDVFMELEQQRFRVLGDESDAQFAGCCGEPRLRRLQQYGHQRIVLADAAAEVDARIEFFGCGRIVAMQDESYIGDDAQQIVFVTVVEFGSFVVAGCQQDFRAGALAQHLLLLVERIFQEFGILQQQQFVEFGQVGGVEADRILDQQDGLHTAVQDVFLGVHLVLDQLDDCDDELRIAVPREDVVQSRTVLLFDAAVDVFRKRGQQRNRNLRETLLDRLGEGEDVGFADVVHRQDEVE